MNAAELDALVDKALALTESGLSWGDAVIKVIGGPCPRAKFWKPFCGECDGDICGARKAFNDVSMHLNFRGKAA